VTTFLLVRHAAHDWVGRGFAGRMPGVALNAQGREEARQLVDRLRDVPLAAVYCSPQQRTHETAAPLAAARGLAIRTDAAFDEIDFGAWTGLGFDEVRRQGEPWTHWVERRSTVQAPGGERFSEVPDRAMAGLRRLVEAHPDDHVLVVSHGDVLKAIVAAVLGLSLDDLERFDIAPASVTTLAMGRHWAQLQLLNALGQLR
jgi:broad specificity phosphatase PhoE